MRRGEALAAAFIVCSGLALAAGVGIASLLRSQVTSRPATEDAGRELDRAAARFAGQAPLRVIRDGQAPLKAPSPTIIGEPTRFLRALVSDARSRRLVRVGLPLRLLRMVKGDGFRYVGELTPLQPDTEFERDRIDLPLEDILRHGPMLVASHSHPSGSRLVVWVE